MATLRADLDLDASAAISEAEAVASALGVSLSSATQEFASELAAALDQALSAANTPIQVEADTAAAENEIANVGAGEEAVIPVDADTSEAEEEISAVGDTAEDAAGGLDSFGNAGTNVAAASDLATGSVAGLGAAAGAMGGGVGVAAGALFGFGAGIGAMFTQASQSIGAVQRLDTASGGLADSFNRIQVGNLDADLQSLSVSLGSDDDAAKDAAASFINMAKASGIAQNTANSTAEAMLALAARAVALDPALGSVGDVAETMGLRLARGGRFAARFNIALTPEEIEAKARAMFGYDAELTQAEKSTAAIAIATERYGDSLQQDIDRGTENPILQLRALRAALEENLEAFGRPLVAPILDLMTSLLPVASGVGFILGNIAEGIFVVVDAFTSMSTPLKIATAALAAFLALLLTGGGGGIAALFTANPILGVAAAISAAAFALGVLNDEGDETADWLASIQKLSTGELLGSFVRSATALSGEMNTLTGEFEAFDGNALESQESLGLFRQVAEENIGTAQRLFNALRNGGADVSEYRKIIQDVAAAQRQQRADTERASQAIQTQGSVTQLAADNVENILTAAQGALPTTTSLFGEATEEAARFGQQVDPALLQQKLNETIAAMTQFNIDLNTLIGAGFEDLAGFAAQQGPIAGGQFISGMAQSIRDGQPQQAQAIDGTIGEFNRLQLTTQGFLTGPFATSVQQGFGGAIAPLPGMAGQVFVDAAGRIVVQTPNVAAKGKGAGDAGTTSFIAGLNGMQGLIPGVMGAAGSTIVNNAPTGAGGAGGEAVGREVPPGVARGISQEQSQAINAAVDLAENALSAAKDALGISSPSKEFESVGRDMGLGMVKGMESTIPAVVRASTELVGTPTTVTNNNQVERSNVYLIRGDDALAVLPGDVHDVASDFLDGRLN